MSGTTVIFFIAGTLVFFVFALAVQMRLLAGVALKRAARAKFEGLDERDARLAVAGAVDGLVDDGPASYLAGEYPGAIRHIRLARKGTFVMPGLLLVIIVAWRLTTGGEV